MTCEVGEEGKNSISSQHDKKAKFAFKMSPGYHGVNLKACRALVLSYFVKPKFCRCRLTSIGTISRLSDYTYRLGVTVSVASYQMCAQSYTEFSLWDPEAHSLSAEILCNSNVKVNKKISRGIQGYMWFKNRAHKSTSSPWEPEWIIELSTQFKIEYFDRIICTNSERKHKLSKFSSQKVAYKLTFAILFLLAEYLKHGLIYNIFLTHLLSKYMSLRSRLALNMNMLL